MQLSTGGRILLAFVALALMEAATPEPVQAQSSLGLEVTAGYGILNGEDFDGLDDAIGFDALGSYAFPTGLELGVGVGFATHEQSGPGDTSAELIDLFGEVRYRFGAPAAETPHLHPFLAGRVGWNRFSLDLTGEDPSASGLMFGAGGGVEYWFTDAVAAVASGFLHLRDYAETDALPAGMGGSEVDIRAGLKVRF